MGKSLKSINWFTKERPVVEVQCQMQQIVVLGHRVCQEYIVSTTLFETKQAQIQIKSL